MRIRPTFAIALVALLIAAIVAVSIWIGKRGGEETEKTEKKTERRSYNLGANKLGGLGIVEQALGFSYTPSSTFNPNPKVDAFSQMGGRLGIPPDGIEIFDYSTQDGSEVDLNDTFNLVKGSGIKGANWGGIFDLWSEQGREKNWKGPIAQHRDFSFEDPLVHHLFNKTLESNQKLQGYITEKPIKL